MAGKQLKALEVTKRGPGEYCDGGGLYLVVQESGSRSWILRTMVRGKRCQIGLGGLDTRSLAEARVAAAELRAKARKGEDVLAERRAKKQAAEHDSSIPTFRAAAIEFHRRLTTSEGSAKARKRQKSQNGAVKLQITSEDHARNWRQSLEAYVFPVFGSKAVDKVDGADVLNAINPIWSTIPDTARRTLRRISKVLEYCQTKEWRNIWIEDGKVRIPMANPCDSIRAALPSHGGTKGHHAALPYPELPQFIQKLRISNSALSVKLAFEFLILTCSRTSEVLEAKWDEIDLEARVWTIPAERMKMSSEHKVPLSPRCVEILTLAKEFNDGAIVFPGRYAGHPLSNTALLMALRRMGHGDLTAHGFRATFKTWAEEKTKFDSLVIEASMAHAVQGIERHYLRTTFIEQRKRLMEAWAAFATAAAAAKVVSIHG